MIKNGKDSNIWTVCCIILVHKVAEKSGEKCTSNLENIAEPVIGSGKVDDRNHLFCRGL